MIFGRLERKYSALSFFPLAVMVGTGAGMALRSAPSAQIVTQLRSTFVPLTSLDNVVLLVGMVGTLSYFIFTRKHEGPLGFAAQIGKWCHGRRTLTHLSRSGCAPPQGVCPGA